MTLKILITGGTGFIGTALVNRLKRESFQITALVRDTKAASEKLGESVHVVRQGVSDTELDRLVRDADAIINLAGEPVLGKRWSTAQKAKIRNSRVFLTERLAQSIGRSEQPPPVFLSASAVGYYGDGGIKILTFGSDSGSGFLADVCVDWEAAALEAASDHVRVCVLRIGMVLGPDGGALDQMITPFKLGLGGPIGSGEQYVSWIHIEDLIELMLTALSDDRYRGVFNATAPEPVIFSDLASVLGAALHRPAFLPLPGFAVRVLFGDASEVILTGQNAIPKRAMTNGFGYKYPSLKGALEHILAAA